MPSSCCSKGFLTESGKKKATVILSTEDQSNFQVTQMRVKVRLCLVFTISPRHVITQTLTLRITLNCLFLCDLRCEKEPLEQNAAWCLRTRRKVLLMQRNISRGSRSTTRGTTRTTKSLYKTSKDLFVAV